MIEPIKIDPKTFLRQHCTLPPLPELFIRMQEILDSDQIDIDEIANLMKSDPALVSQVLKMINSAYYGLPREIGDVKYAIGLLGLNETHRIMLSFAIADALHTDQNDRLRELWFHSFHTALCAEYLAKENRAYKYPPDCWSAALLHDVGKLVYLKFFPEHYNMLKDYMTENGCLFSTAEMEFDLPQSAYLGTLLCDHWKLPLMIREACEAHTLEMLYENVSGLSQPNVFVLAAVSNLLSTLSTETLSDPVKEEITSTAMQALHYDNTNFADLMTVVENLKSDAEKFICHVI